jgi:hypothetical protein
MILFFHKTIDMISLWFTFMVLICFNYIISIRLWYPSTIIKYLVSIGYLYHEKMIHEKYTKSMDMIHVYPYVYREYLLYPHLSTLIHIYPHLSTFIYIYLHLPTYVWLYTKNKSLYQTEATSPRLGDLVAFDDPFLLDTKKGKPPSCNDGFDVDNDSKYIYIHLDSSCQCSIYLYKIAKYVHIYILYTWSRVPCSYPLPNTPFPSIFASYWQHFEVQPRIC